MLDTRYEDSARGVGGHSLYIRVGFVPDQRPVVDHPPKPTGRSTTNVRYRMKTPSYMVAAICGCVFTAVPAFADAFADFRAGVQRIVPVDWKCGEIRTIEGQTLFDVRSTKNRFNMTITKHDLISQKEWSLRAERMKQTFESFVADKEIKNIDALLVELPDGRFKDTAVSVHLVEPELYYPEIEADDKEAKVVVKTILRLLKLYTKSEQAMASDGPKSTSRASSADTTAPADAH